MPPPHDGNEYLPFKDMIALEKINSSTYRSKALPFSPGASGRAYGGHVFCQAAWAAAQTVDPGFIVHVCACDLSHGFQCEHFKMPPERIT